MKQIVFTQKDTVKLLDTEVVNTGADDVKVETVITSISCGTEKASIRGERVGWGEIDPSVSVFPRFEGYSASGIVTEVGENVQNIKVGDSVSVSWSKHAQYNVLAQALITKFDPEKVSYNAAALAHIATFPLAAIRKVGLEIGESVLVMGLGILGLFAVKLAHIAGACPVIAADPVPERRAKALANGADYALDPLAPDFAEQVKLITNGGVKCAIEVTGVGAGLDETLDCMARFGRVALLGCTRNSDFSIDYYKKVHGPGISLIGAHTMARPGFESSSGLFTEKDDRDVIIRLCECARLNFDDMIDEVFDPRDCKNVYTRLINDINFPVVSQFDWRKVK